MAKQGLSFAEAAARLGVHANLLRKWKRVFEASGPPAGPRQPTALEAEVKRLREEVRRLPGYSQVAGDAAVPSKTQSESL